jgi:hypothetical protein
MWEGGLGILDEGGKVIWDEPGRALREDRGVLTLPQLGLYGWYRADAFGLSSGAPVTTWPDQSGEGNDLAKQDTGALTFLTGQLNGLPIVRFAVSGSSPSLQRNSVNESPAGPVSLGGAITGVTQVLVVRCLHNPSFPSIYLTNTDFSDSAGAILRVTDGVNATFSQDNSFPITEPINDWQVLSMRLDNTSNQVQMRTNNQVAGGAYGFDVIGDAMGIINGNCEVAEMLWYREALSDDDLQTARLYMAGKYGLSISV